MRMIYYSALATPGSLVVSRLDVFLLAIKSHLQYYVIYYTSVIEPRSCHATPGNSSNHALGTEQQHPSVSDMGLSR